MPLKPYGIAVITCYRQPDYVRAVSIRQAIASQPLLKLITVKNKQQNLLRYLEIICRLLYVRIRRHPAVYIVTFRGYELLPFIWLLVWPHPVIFDEFINLIEWTIDEHHKYSPTSWRARTLQIWYRRQLSHYPCILSDTPAHAAYSAIRTPMPLQKIHAIAVGTDETKFYPAMQPAKDELFTIFFYATMLPLHGIDIILNTAVALKEHHNILFEIVGGSAQVATTVTSAQKSGAHIKYLPNLPYDELPHHLNHADLFLGGPFGNTVQSRNIVTGKTYQALACAIPTVVGQNLATDFLTNRVNCLLVPQASPDALAATILWGSHHRQQLIHIGLMGRKIFEQYASSEVLGAQLLQIISDLLDT
ncbi:MAG: hypothetical protein NVS1B7_7410 [Candidatus Saccharimonadales bacterium]